MKIRSQLILGAALFGVVLVVLAASMVTTTAELGRLDEQVQIADRIGVGANDLNYLSNEYLLYGEPQQADRWEARYAALGDDLANLSAGTPAQQALVAAITEDRSRVKSVFDEIAADRAAEGRPTPPPCPSPGAGSGSRPRGSPTTPRASRRSSATRRTGCSPSTPCSSPPCSARSPPSS